MAARAAPSVLSLSPVPGCANEPGHRESRTKSMQKCIAPGSPGCYRYPTNRTTG